MNKNNYIINGPQFHRLWLGIYYAMLKIEFICFANAEVVQEEWTQKHKKQSQLQDAERNLRRDFLITENNRSNEFEIVAGH